MEKEIVTQATVQDPVCGMQVVPGIARSWDYLYQGIVYHFCGPDCRSRFAAGPGGILQGGPGQPRVAHAPVPERDETDWWSSLRERMQEWWGRF